MKHLGSQLLVNCTPHQHYPTMLIGGFRFARGGLVLALLAVATRVNGAAPTPPPQPETGPGGSAYAHAVVTSHTYGTGNDQYWVFEPGEPTPRTAPLIVFSHGWGAMLPRPYQGWIDHLVRRGNIVVFPRYQADLTVPPRELTPNAVRAVTAALTELQTGDHVRPDLSKFALVGHSVGGLLTANLATLAAAEGLPVPRAMMSVQPGRSRALLDRIAVPLANLSQIPAGTLLLAVAGDADRIVGTVDAERVYRESTQVPAANKDFVLVVSDDHGHPPLTANHLSPCAGGSEVEKERVTRPVEDGRPAAAPGREGEPPEVAPVTLPFSSLDALDWYGYWKLFDALCDAAFLGQHREYALGNTPQQRSMGQWNDGVPVKELRIGLPAAAAWTRPVR